MKNQTFTAALLSALLITALAGTLLINSAAADPIIVLSPQPIYVTSPVNNKVYNVSTVALTFYVLSDNKVSQKVIQLQYFIDSVMQGQFAGDSLSYPFSVTLPKLTDGIHSVYVSATVSVTERDHHFAASWNYIESGQISFTVDTVVPRVSILSTQGKTYAAADASFNFTVNEPASWVGYSVDGKDKITITDDALPARLYGSYNYHIVLKGLPDGAHSLKVYTTDTAGNTGESETIQFTIAQETQASPETQTTTQDANPVPTNIVAASATAIVAVISIGFIVYFRKRKR